MSSWTSYRGLQIPSGTIPNPAGGKLRDDLMRLAERSPESNFEATTAPTVDDDVSSGYYPGSLWLNTLTEEVFVCISNGVGTAVWSAVAFTGDLGSAAFLDVGTSADDVVQLDGAAKLPAVDGSQLTNLPAPVVTTDNLASASTVDLDFNGSTKAKLNIANNVTFTTSNKAANKSKTLTVFGHASNYYNLVYPSGWKNCGGTSLPTSIPPNTVYQFHMTVFGTNESDVVVEFVNGAGVVVSLTTPVSIAVYKGSSSTVVVSDISGGSNLGYMIVDITTSIGYFTVGYPANGFLSFTLFDGITPGNYTSAQVLTAKMWLSLVLQGLTWYSNPSYAVESGTLSIGVYDGTNGVLKTIGVSSYGDDAVQQLDWTDSGLPFSPTAGKFKLNAWTYGTTGKIDVTGGASALQSALTTLMGSDAPSVSGSGATYTFTFSNGSLAHTSVPDLSVTYDVDSPNNGANGSWSFNKTSNGDGVSTADSYSGTWDYYQIGEVVFDGVVVIKQPYGGSGTSPTIGGVSYTLVDSGSSFTLTAGDFVDHGTISATPSYGVGLVASVTTIVPGNS